MAITFFRRCIAPRHFMLSVWPSANRGPTRRNLHVLKRRSQSCNPTQEQCQLKHVNNEPLRDDYVSAEFRSHDDRGPLLTNLTGLVS